MQDIIETQARLRAALDRISAAVETSKPAPEGGTDRLAAALAEERAVRERLEGDAETHRRRAEDLEREAAAMRAQLAALDADRARLKAAVETLGETCESLRRDLGQDATVPDADRDAMAAEIEALRAARESDRTEIEAIVAILTEGRQSEETQHG